MGEKVTAGRIRQLLQANSQDILKQLGYEDIMLGIVVNDAGAFLHVSVRPERLSSMPKSVVVAGGEGPVSIPLKVTGDYEAVELH